MDLLPIQAKSLVGLRRSLSSYVRFCERGTPVLLPLGSVMPGNMERVGGAGRNRTDA